MTRIQRRIFLWNLLFFLVSSFVPLQQQHSIRIFNEIHSRNEFHLRPLWTATDPRLISIRSDDEENSNNNNNNNNNVLELDETTGCLMLGQNDGDVLVKGLDPSIWTASRPQNGKTNSLFLHTSHPEERAEHQTVLGDLISCRRLLACSRLTRYWMGPKVGVGANDLPFDTQFLLIEIEEDKQYALMLPLVDNGFRASLHCDDDSSIGILCAAESGDAAVTAQGMQALYVAVGEDPFSLVKEGFANVAQEKKTFQTLDNKALPPSVNDFGWCTWDAFYSKVDPEGILNGIEALRKAGVPPRTLILDDGWQEVNPNPPEEETQVTGSKKLDMLESLVEAVTRPFVKMVTNWYMDHVQTAPHGSIPNIIWSFLANTILKAGLWNFFDTETDFIRQLSGFNPNDKFETTNKSLKDLVTNLKTNLGVKSVYCWHALHGYWRGVSEECGRKAGINVTNVFPKPPKGLLKIEPHAAWDPVSLFGVGIMTTEKDLTKFYDLIHTPLVEAGVDGVKVDVQSGVSAAGDGVGGGPHIAKLYTKAMESSVKKRFPSGNGATNTINCMCHSTENLYRYQATSVARASEDFFPTKPESHTVHLVNVAYNSLFIGEICLPDWDMFHSNHESAGLHAAARAIGGCPVYVSDKPGDHDPDLLRKLVLPTGEVLRAQKPGRPTKDCLFVDVTSDKISSLKIWNENKYGGVVGAFNVQGVAWNFDTHENEVLDDSPPSVVAQTKAYDIESLKNHEGPFVVWKHQSQKLQFLETGNSVTESNLDHREWEIFTFAPVEIMDSRLMWAPLGLVDMMNSGGAIQSTGALESLDDGTTVARFETRGPGRFVAFATSPPKRILVDESTNLEFVYNDATGELSFVLPDEKSEGRPHHITVEWNDQ